MIKEIYPHIVLSICSIFALLIIEELISVENIIDLFTYFIIILFLITPVVFFMYILIFKITSIFFKEKNFRKKIELEEDFTLVISTILTSFLINKIRNFIIIDNLFIYFFIIIILIFIFVIIFYLVSCHFLNFHLNH